MWVEKRKNGYKFVERYSDPLTGQYKRVSVVLDKNNAQTRKQAQKALNEKIEKALEDKTVDITLSELIRLYEKDQMKTVKIQTCERNMGACRSVMKLLGEDILADKITAGYVRKKFIESGRENGTLNEWLTRYKALIRWGYRNDYIADISYLQKLNKFDDVPHREKIQDKFLEKEELQMLLDGMKIQKWKDLTEFLALSGLRFGEAAALLRSDVDLNNRMIHVTKNYNQTHDKVDTTKTGTSTRDVYMQDQLYELCKRMLSDTKVINLSKTFFQGTRKDHIQYDIYAKYLRENSEKILGRKITPHTLRHTHASLLAENRIDIETISRRLGHANSKITKEIYLHVTRKLKEKENEEIKKLKII